MDLRDKILICRDCGRRFIFTVHDQQFYALKGFTHTPGRCPECRTVHRLSHDDGRRQGERMAEVPHGSLRATRQAATGVLEAPGKNGPDLHNQDISVLRAEVMELSYPCEALVAEKAELGYEKASLLEKVGLLASERDYLKSALAAVGRPMAVPEKAGNPTSRLWWKRISGWRGGTA